MPSFSHIENTDDFGRLIFKEEKKIDINLVYNQKNLSIDITRLSQVPIFIDNEPLENWIKPGIKSEHSPSNHLSSQEQIDFSFDTILKEKKPELDPEKQQQYAAFLSLFSSQSIFKDYLVYLDACGFIPTNLQLNIHIALHKEALYIRINCEGHPLQLKSNDMEEPRNASKAKKKDLKGTAIYKIVLTEVPIDKQKLIQDTSPKNTNRIKIERSLLESKLTCLKKYAAQFNPHIEEQINPPVTGNSRLPSFLSFLLDKIISLLNFIKDIFKKNNLGKQNKKEQSKEDIDIYSRNIHQKEEKFKLDTLYFDPSCNKLARNLEDFPKTCSSEATKSDQSEPLPHKEEVLITTPTIPQNNHINKKKPSVTNEDRRLQTNTHQPEKKVKSNTYFADKVARKITIDSKSINRERTKSNKQLKKRLKNSQLQLNFFKKQKENAYSNSKSILARSQGR